MLRAWASTSGVGGRSSCGSAAGTEPPQPITERGASTQVSRGTQRGERERARGQPQNYLLVLLILSANYSYRSNGWGHKRPPALVTRTRHPDSAGAGRTPRFPPPSFFLI
jgi:hypothetical protein